MNQSSKSIITVFILILPIAIVGVLVCRPIVKSFDSSDDSRQNMVAVFFSPTNPANRIFFIDDRGGIIDREFLLYAERTGKKAQFVARLQAVEETGRFDFAGLQWTKDGEVIIGSLILTRAHKNEEPAAVIAYDFSEDKSIGPYPGGISVSPTYTEAKWHESELIIQKLVAAHGGLGDYKISDEMVKSNEVATSFQPYFN